MQQLEAYLGGELPSEESGVTWREERDILTTRIRVGGYKVVCMKRRQAQCTARDVHVHMLTFFFSYLLWL